MKFSIAVEDFQAALNTASGLANRGALPILQCLLLQAGDDRLTVTGTNLEMEIKACKPISMESRGALAVDATKLKSFVGLLPRHGEVIVQASGQQWLNLSCGNSRLRLAGQAEEGFPTFDSFNTKLSLSMHGDALWSLLDGVAFAMARGDVRYYLNGALLEVGVHELTAVASDGHRMAMCSGSCLTEQEWKGILPALAVRELIRLAKNAGEVEIGFGEKAMAVTFGNIVFSSRLIEGQYPDWRRFMESRISSTVEIDRVPLIAALQRLSLIEEYEQLNPVRLNATGQSLQLGSGGGGCDEGEDEIPVNSEGESLCMRLNAGYLIDALKHLAAEKIVMTAYASGRSVKITSPVESGRSYLVMAMNL